MLLRYAPKIRVGFSDAAALGRYVEALNAHPFAGEDIQRARPWALSGDVLTGTPWTEETEGIESPATSAALHFMASLVQSSLNFEAHDLAAGSVEILRIEVCAEEVAS